MKYTKNNNLKLVDGTDKVLRKDIFENFEIIDEGLDGFYVAELVSNNVYKITTPKNLSSLNNGFSIKVAIPVSSTGAVSIKVDNVNPVQVKDANNNVVTDFCANGVYLLTYYNSFFIYASVEEDLICDSVSFTSGDLLKGKYANDSTGKKVAGTMAVMSGYQNGGYGQGSGYFAFNNLNPGYFPSNYEIRCPMSTIASAIKMTANKIVKGNTFLGIAGSLVTGGGKVVHNTATTYSKDEGLKKNHYSVKTFVKIQETLPEHYILFVKIHMSSTSDRWAIYSPFINGFKYYVYYDSTYKNGYRLEQTDGSYDLTATSKVKILDNNEFVVFKDTGKTLPVDYYIYYL